MNIFDEAKADIVDVPVSSKRIDQKILNAIKEWGGIATVIITILYTFPFDIFDRISHASEHHLAACARCITGNIFFASRKN
jgi:hypothetical protein